MFPHTIFMSNDRKVHRDLDIIFDTIDDWMLEGKWDLVQDTFKTLCEYDYVDQVETHLDHLLGFLTISLAGKEYIGHWRKLAYERIKDSINKHGLSQNVLIGLE